MATKRAKTIEDADFEDLMSSVFSTSRRPEVDRVVFLLSFKAGLRVQEIAGLRWSVNILNARGEINTVRQSVEIGGKKRKIAVGRLFVSGDIGKYGRERTLSMHSSLLEALKTLHAKGYEGPYVIPPARKGASTDLGARSHALMTRINRLYAEMGFNGCTSHSGRRTMLTKASRSDRLPGYGLKAVQMLAGHANLASTEAYLDVPDDIASLVESL